MTTMFKKFVKDAAKFITDKIFAEKIEYVSAKSGFTFSVDYVTIHIDKASITFVFQRTNNEYVIYAADEKDNELTLIASNGKPDYKDFVDSVNFM